MKDRQTQFYDALHPYISQEFAEWLDANGFFSAPASTKYHGSYEGGLFDHSIAVMDALVDLTHDNHLHWQDVRSPFVVGMFHDLCKIDQYEVIKYPEDPKVNYSYRKDTLLTGHGDKSVTLLSQFMDLTEEERLCIHYHMGAFTERDEWRNYTDAVKKYPNVLWTHHADMIASHVKGI